MKKTMVYTAAALLSLSALAGCGRMGDMDTPVNPTQRPVTTDAPMIVSPDPEDGYVRDEDGIITDDDTGRESGGGTNTRPSGSPAATADTGMGANGGRTASPSPSPAAENGSERK